MKRLLLTLSLLFALLVPASALAAPAFNPIDNACKAGTNTSPACKANGSNPLTGPNGTITKATKIIAVIAGVAAVIVVVIGGLMFVTSGGDPQQAAKARSVIIYALVGLVIIVLAGTIITFIVSKV